MSEDEKADLEYMLDQIERQAEREVELNDAVLTKHEKHIAFTAGLNAVSSFDTDLAELAANPTLPNTSDTS